VTRTLDSWVDKEIQPFNVSKMERESKWFRDDLPTVVAKFLSRMRAMKHLDR
jgi:hypothetical protein